jgi:hypothetical protein
VTLADAASRSRSRTAAAAASVRAVPASEFDWRGAFALAGAGAGNERGTTELARDASGWGVETGEVFLRLVGGATSSVLTRTGTTAGSVASGTAGSGAAATESEADEGEEGGSESVDEFDGDRGVERRRWRCWDRVSGGGMVHARLSWKSDGRGEGNGLRSGRSSGKNRVSQRDVLMHKVRCWESGVESG